MTREIDKLIADKIRIIDSKDTGITLISASTGKGKTYALIQYAKEAIDKGKYDKVVIIEPRHSILKEVQEKLVGWGIENILYLQNAAENTIQYIDSVNINTIKDKNIKEKLKSLVDLVAIYKPGVDNVQNKLAEAEIFKQKSELKRYCIERKKKMDSADLAEVTKIFPEELKAKYHFILMTMDKLFYTLDTIKKENRILTKRMFSERTLVIIDELDKCYTVALNRCAENRDTLDDLLAVIQNAYAFISESDSRWQRFDDDETNTYIEKKREELLSEINELHKEYGVLNNFIFRGSSGEKLELFVSRDKTFVASKGKHYKLSILNDESRTILEQVNRKTTFSVVRFAVACKRVVRHVLNFIYELGEAYREDKDKDASYEDGLQYGISQVFNKTISESGHYLNYAMDNSIKTQSLRIKDNEYIDDISVCNNGFTHCIFEDKPGTNHTYMTSAGIDLTPENIFVWLGKNANVAGLSATQQIPTVLNLDMDYVNRALNGKLDMYTPDDFDSVNSMVTTTDNIECDVIRSFNSDRQKVYVALSQLLKEEEIEEVPLFKENVFEMLDTIDSYKGIEDAMKDREYKRFFALCQFVFRKKAVSGLVVLNSNYGLNLLNAFKDFVERVSQIMDFNNIKKENIYQIYANNMESHINEIKEKLNNGIKCLIISNKEALGQGVNIQYDRDFNFFYQEDPTYIFPVAKPGELLAPIDINKYIYLVMKMSSTGEITDYEMKGWIGNIVANIMHKINCYSSVANAKTSIFIQGLGRTTRGSEKEDYELIFFDEDLCEYLHLDTVQAEKTPELIAVEKRIERYKEEKQRSYTESMTDVDRALRNNSSKLQKEIQRLLTTFTKPNMENERVEALNKYKNILRLLFKYGLWPTYVDPADTSLFNELGYVLVDKPLDKIYVKSESDKYCEDLICVSADFNKGFTLLDSQSVLKLRTYQKPEGKCWQINPKALNLLQGVVGEVKFKELFEANTGYKLCKLPMDEYEVCGDYMVENTDIYVDVKNFSEYGPRDVTDFAMDKLETIKQHNENGQLMIVNVFAKKTYEGPNDKYDDLLLVSNVLGENNVKYWNNFKAIEQWIDHNT